MRSMLAILPCIFLLQQGSSLGTPDSRILNLPNGRVEQKTYKNEAFEISFRIKDHWTLQLIPPGSLLFAPELASDDLVNRCSRAIFSSEPEHGDIKTFGPKATYFVLEPECFPGAPFPQSTHDREAVSQFAQRVVHALAKTPYIAADGADLGGFDAGGRAFVMFTTEKTLESQGVNSARIEKQHVNTMLMVTESSGYWIAMAEVLDDKSKKIMQASGVDISVKR